MDIHIIQAHCRRLTAVQYSDSKNGCIQTVIQIKYGTHGSFSAEAGKDCRIRKYGRRIELQPFSAKPAGKFSGQEIGVRFASFSDTSDKGNKSTMDRFQIPTLRFYRLQQCPAHGNPYIVAIMQYPCQIGQGRTPQGAAASLCPAL